MGAMNMGGMGMGGMGMGGMGMGGMGAGMDANAGCYTFSEYYGHFIITQPVYHLLRHITVQIYNLLFFHTR